MDSKRLTYTIKNNGIFVHAVYAFYMTGRLLAGSLTVSLQNSHPRLQTIQDSYIALKSITKL